MTGWTHDLPRIPGYDWVRLPGYERAPTIAEIELHGMVGTVLAATSLRSVGAKIKIHVEDAGYEEIEVYGIY